MLIKHWCCYRRGLQQSWLISGMKGEFNNEIQLYIFIMIQVLHNSSRRFCDILSFWITDISQTWQGALLRSTWPRRRQPSRRQPSQLKTDLFHIFVFQRFSIVKVASLKVASSQATYCVAVPPARRDCLVFSSHIGVCVIHRWALFCLGYTVTYGDIDIFCTKNAFDKFIQKVMPLEAGIRLLRYNRLLLQWFPQLLQHDGWRIRLGLRFWSFQRILLGAEDETPGDGGSELKFLLLTDHCINFGSCWGGRKWLCCCDHLKVRHRHCSACNIWRLLHSQVIIKLWYDNN